MRAYPVATDALVLRHKQKYYSYSEQIKNIKLQFWNFQVVYGLDH